MLPGEAFASSRADGGTAAIGGAGSARAGEIFVAVRDGARSLGRGAGSLVTRCCFGLAGGWATRAGRWAFDGAGAACCDRT